MNSYGNESERLATPNSQPCVGIRVDCTPAVAVTQGKPAFEDGYFEGEYKYPRLFGLATVHASSACHSIEYTAEHLRKFLDDLKADTWRIGSVELAVKWLDEAATELRNIDGLWKLSMTRRREVTPHAT